MIKQLDIEKKKEKDLESGQGGDDKQNNDY